MASIEEAKEIIKSTSISTIVNFYHPISKRGANYEGLCPFHSDSNPSLKINDDKGIYKCFVCGAAGDSIKFVQDKLNLDFKEAIFEIASQLSISVEENKKKDPKFETALKVLNAGNRIYRKYSSEASPKEFLNFLKERNISEQTAEEFQIGYAPAHNIVTNYLTALPTKDKTFAISVAENLGIIRKSKNSQGHYDFFRKRVTFPIWDHSGKVRGFSTRVIDPEHKPKYLNSGESFVFDKGNILYGFHFAKKHIREMDSVIIVEGNMDVIMLHQFGFKNSVATQGVALSQASIKLLSNMTKNIYLAMDSDNAGMQAMKKINHEFLQIQIIPKFISFEPAKDPDEYLNQFGRLELQKLIDNAPSFVDHLIAKTIPSEIPQSTDKKLEVLTNIFQIISSMGSNLMATERVTQCAKALNLKSSNDDIINEYKQFLNSKTVSHKTAPKNVNAAQPDDSIKVTERIVKPLIIQTQDIPKVQKLTLETLLMHPECLESNQITEMLDFIDHFEVKRIVNWLREIYSEIDEADYTIFLRQKLEETLPDQIAIIIKKSITYFDSSKLENKVKNKIINDLVINLKIDSLKKQRSLLRDKQRVSQSDDESLGIISEVQEIEKQLIELKNK